MNAGTSDLSSEHYKFRNDRGIRGFQLAWSSNLLNVVVPSLCVLLLRCDLLVLCLGFFCSNIEQ